MTGVFSYGYRFNAGTFSASGVTNLQGYENSAPQVQYKNSGKTDSFSLNNDPFASAYGKADNSVDNWNFQNAGLQWENDCKPAPPKCEPSPPPKCEPKPPQDCEPKPPKCDTKPPKDCEPKAPPKCEPKPPQDCEPKPPKDCKPQPQPEDCTTTVVKQPTPKDCKKPDKPKHDKPPKAPKFKDAAFWGDPHIKGFGGEKYDVQGKNNKYYNLLSDKNVQLNAKFQTRDKNHISVVSQAGIQVGDKKISFGAKGGPSLDGKAMKTSHKYNLGGGAYAIWNGSKLKVNTGEYTIGLQQKADGKVHYLNGSIKVNGNPFADHVAPHGLIGQTADMKPGAKSTGKKPDLQGSNVIDGKLSNYEVSNLWGTNDKYNRFDP